MIPTPPSSTWSVSDAKNHLSTVLARAHVYGPQLITNRGVPDSYVLTAAEFESLRGGENAAGHAKPKQSLFEVMQSLATDLNMDVDLDIERVPQKSRDIDLEIE